MRSKTAALVSALRCGTRRFGYVRSSNEKAIAGVCAGLARRFGWNLATVRSVFALGLLFGFAAAAVYGAAWLLFEEGPTNAS